MIKTLDLSLEQSVIQVKGHIVSDMDGEKVCLSVENGKYYNLGEIGGRIWELVETPITITRIVETLLREYEVEKTECEEHVLSFLGNLLEEDLIETPER